MSELVDDIFDEEPDFDDSPYCQCDEQPTEEEEVSGKCSACGKLLP